MKIGKCIDIKDNKIFVIKYSTEEIEELTTDDLVNGQRTSSIYIINLNIKNSVSINQVIDRFTIGKYSRLSIEGISKESEVAATKSDVLGTSTYRDGSNLIQANKISDDLIITDKAYRIDKNIRAKTVIFIGKRMIENESMIENYFIKCRKAIIKNPTIMSCLVDGLVELHARHIILKHEFIDINTVYEVLCYLDYVIIGSKKSDYIDTIVQVDFNKVGVSDEEVIELCRKLIHNKIYGEYKKEILNVYFDSLLPYMSLMCSMYTSTGYKHEELLEWAVICQEEFLNKSSVTSIEVTRYKDIRTLINRLHSGYRI